MPKELSCGFILFDRGTGKVLGCHPTGKPEGPEMSYDIPKGHIEEGETPLDAAKRELREETGLVLPEGTAIHEIGRVPYQVRKNLHLFSAALDGLEAGIGRLHCDSMFTDSFGNRKREVDSYTMTDYWEWFFKNLQPYVRQEMARARLEEPVYVFAADADGTPVRTAAHMSSSKRDGALRFLDELYGRNVWPDGFGYDFGLADGRHATVELEEVKRGLQNPVRVDINGGLDSLDEFPIDDWFEAASSPELGQ